MDVNMNIEANTPDFNRLPDLVWVKIMAYMPLGDQFRVSETCNRLNRLLDRRKLWSEFTVHCMGTSDQTGRKLSLGYLDQNVLIDKFGAFFKDLTITVNGDLTFVREDIADVLTQISKTTRLETLRISARKTATGECEEPFQIDSRIISGIFDLLENAKTLREIHVHSWPLMEGMSTDEPNIYSEIIKNKTIIENLRHVTLFEAHDYDYVFSYGKYLLLPRASFVRNILSHFNHVTVVGLLSSMLSDELLQLYADQQRKPLDTLKVYIQGRGKWRPSDDDFAPRIRSNTWLALVDRNRKFRVECFVLDNHIQGEHVARMFPMEAPVAFFRFLGCSYESD